MFARSVAGARRQQQRLRSRLILAGGPRRVALVAGADVSYDRGSDRFHAAVVTLALPSLATVEESTAEGESPFPYVPGYLSYREGPLLLRAFRALRRKPDLVLFDGQGIAHPRGIGIASHLGLLLDLPSIGCGKSLLVGEYDPPGRRVGDWTPLRHEGRRVGAALRTREGAKPIFVSAGHRIGLSAAIRWVLRCGEGFRVPAPVRRAHALANRLRLGED